MGRSSKPRKRPQPTVKPNAPRKAKAGSPERRRVQRRNNLGVKNPVNQPGGTKQQRNENLTELKTTCDCSCHNQTEG